VVRFFAPLARVVRRDAGARRSLSFLAPPFSAFTLRLSASIRLMTLLGFGSSDFGTGLPACLALISDVSALS
jgi:hypothetical protein